MKKLNIITVLLLGFLWMTQTVDAQKNFHSFGPGVAIPMGVFNDDCGIGLGGNYQVEFGLSEKFALGTGIEAYYFLTQDHKTDVLDYKQSSIIVPLKGYARYYLTSQAKGLYGAMNVGFYPVFMMYSDEAGKLQETDSDFDFGWAPEAGFFLTEGISVYVKYQFIYFMQEEYGVDFTEIGEVEQTLTYWNVGVNLSF